MLSLNQKESILRKSGIPVPPFPARRTPRSPHLAAAGSRHLEAERAADHELAIAVAQWKAELEELYDVHIRQRAESAIQTVKNNAKSGLGSERP